jgi:hypothetical protein
METSIETLYNRYDVKIEFLNGIAGGTPLNSDLVRQHMRLFAEGVSNPLKYAKKVEGEVTEEAMEAHLKRVSAGFPADEGGAYIRGFQFNAMLKDAAQRTKDSVKTRGLGNTIRDGGLLFPDKIYLGQPVVIVERPVKPDNSASATIKVFQVAEGVKLAVPCAVLNNGDIDEQLWQRLWVVAQGIGLGANRHLGYGRFRLVSLEKTEDFEITDLFNARGKAGKNASPVPEAVTPRKTRVA